MGKSAVKNREDVVKDILDAGWNFNQLLRIRDNLKDQKEAVYKSFARGLAFSMEWEEDDLRILNENRQADLSNIHHAIETVDEVIFKKCPARLTLHSSLPPGDSCIECGITIPITLPVKRNKKSAARSKAPTSKAKKVGKKDKRRR